MRHTSILHKRILRERRASSFGPVKTKKTVKAADDGDLKNYVGIEFALKHATPQNVVTDFMGVCLKTARLVDQQLETEAHESTSPATLRQTVVMLPVLRTEADAIIEASMYLSEVVEGKTFEMSTDFKKKMRSESETRK